ncbi:DUF1800 domain-containing protein [Qipengyuania vesicularis]|uniref:DUF1800 domain-containing protein n=1 Tax=Qipengyuania vesicularis TaxID=2867232 RepID=UPI001C882E58|nr:DUF1800 domain-containing protein [Qipengyuania vesicularis]MBX7526367.1 DUF1800 domain-containing protein [Qipengyuania vesicularis]
MTPTAIALNRFGLGYRRGDDLPLDPRADLKAQVAAFDPAPPELGNRALDGEELRRTVEDIFAYRDMRRSTSDTEEREEMQRLRARSNRETYAGDVARRARVAIESNTPFMERMVHFWANHFAVSTDKTHLPLLAGPFEFAAIRLHVGGFFADLLRAAALHPAMLAYLDQSRSQGPDSKAARNRRRRGRPERGLNENLGREILELHTLGVDGGYAQEDVIELAKALTGWTVPGMPFTDPSEPQPNGANFYAFIHQPGVRRVMGRNYPDTGARQALAILDDLAAHPSTARFIATKLARHFAGDAPPSTLVDRLADAFLGSGGHLPTVYEALIDAPEAWQSGPVRYRQPWEWAVAVLRASEQSQLPERRFAMMMRDLGQQVWAPGSPAGWDDRDASWTGSTALLRRVEAAERIAASAKLDDTRALAEALFPGSLSRTTRQTIDWAESNEMAFALLMVSPEMLRR